jgi:uncharacterized protein (DUF885 family)
MKKLTFLLITISLLLSCEHKTQPVTRPVSGDAAFQKLADDYLTGYLQWRPATGVALGYHQYDGKVTDLSKESMGKELGRLKDFDQRLNVTDTTSLSAKQFYDFRILRSAIKNEIFNFEDMGTYNKNPMTYAQAIDVSIYIKRNFAPLEDRVKSIIAIEKTATTVFIAAKANLKDSLAKPYIQTAIEIANGTVDFLGGDLKIALKNVKNDSLMTVFNATNKAAIAAISGYAAWLQKDKLPKATNKYAIGKASYQKMLLYSEGITLSPEKILAIGLSELKKEQEPSTQIKNRLRYTATCKKNIQQPKT